jgi:hypothetical protein
MKFLHRIDPDKAVGVVLAFIVPWLPLLSWLA